MKKLIFTVFFTALVLALDVASFGQSSQGITNAQLRGTNNNLVSGATLNIVSGATLTYQANSAAADELLFLSDSGGTVYPLTLGAGLSITGSGPYTLVAGSSSSANPSATIGLSAVNGSATTYMTSDSAPPLSQAIVPTWTGLHTFSPTATATSGTDYGVKFTPTLNQRNATNFSLIFGNETVTQAGTGNQYLEELAVGGTDKWEVDSTGTVQKGAWNGTTIPLANIASLTAGTVIGNNTGSTAAGADITPSQVLDIIDNTQGDIIYRSSTGWTFLPAGTSGQVLSTGGSAANPSWASAGVTTLAGTANEVIASASSGAVTLSTPQAIGTGSSLQFKTLGLGMAPSGTNLGFFQFNSNATAGTPTIIYNGLGFFQTGGLFLGADGQYNSLQFNVWGGGHGNVATFLTGVAARGTQASPSTLNSGDEIFALVATGYNGSAYVNGDRIKLDMVTTEGWTTGANGTAFQFGVTPTGTTSEANYVEIAPAGVVTEVAGATLFVKSGSNAKAGTFTLTGGTVTVANTSVDANSVIVVTLKTVGGTRNGNPDIVPTASTGFVATEIGGVLDTSTYNYVIIEVN